MNKVNVFTADDVDFGKLRWWSNWIDVSTYNYDNKPWLIQMKISRTNKKKFRSVNISGMSAGIVRLGDIGDLTQMRRASDD